MTAIEPPVRILNFALASEGPSTHAKSVPGIYYCFRTPNDDGVQQ